jgi:acyl-CoA synthetase (NDP forming)
MQKMDDMEAAKLLKSHGIPIARHLLAGTEAEAVAAAKKIGYPVVIKISSPDIIHKTDAGVIVVGVEDVFHLRKAYKQIITNAKKVKKRKKKAEIKGVIVQEMISGSEAREVIVGGKHDPQFGPVYRAHTAQGCKVHDLKHQGLPCAERRARAEACKFLCA